MVRLIIFAKYLLAQGSSARDSDDTFQLLSRADVKFDPSWMRQKMDQYIKHRIANKLAQCPS